MLHHESLTQNGVVFIGSFFIIVPRPVTLHSVTEHVFPTLQRSKDNEYPQIWFGDLGQNEIADPSLVMRRGEVIKTEACECWRSTITNAIKRAMIKREVAWKDASGLRYGVTAWEVLHGRPYGEGRTHSGRHGEAHVAAPWDVGSVPVTVSGR